MMLTQGYANCMVSSGIEYLQNKIPESVHKRISPKLAFFLQPKYVKLLGILGYLH